MFVSFYILRNSWYKFERAGVEIMIKYVKWKTELWKAEKIWNGPKIKPVIANSRASRVEKLEMELPFLFEYSSQSPLNINEQTALI